MQVVDEYSDDLVHIKLSRCDDPDSSDHLHFDLKMGKGLYHEELTGVVPWLESDSMEDIATRIFEVYRANAKKLWREANGSITIQ